MKMGDQELTFTLRAPEHNGEALLASDTEDSSTLKKICKAHENLLSISLDHVHNNGGTDKSSSYYYATSGDETINNISPATPPIYSHRNSNRRKGVPHRAPF